MRLISEMTFKKQANFLKFSMCKNSKSIGNSRYCDREGAADESFALRGERYHETLIPLKTNRTCAT